MREVFQMRLGVVREVSVDALTASGDLRAAFKDRDGNGYLSRLELGDAWEASVSRMAMRSDLFIDGYQSLANALAQPSALIARGRQLGVGLRLPPSAAGGVVAAVSGVTTLAASVWRMTERGDFSKGAVIDAAETTAFNAGAGYLVTAAGTAAFAAVSGAAVLAGAPAIATAAGIAAGIGVSVALGRGVEALRDYLVSID
jgi:hypothetical protein